MTASRFAGEPPFDRHPGPAPSWATWVALDGIDEQSALTMFTVYERPLDYPSHWVVRRSFVLRGEIRQDVVPRLASDLEGAREHIPPFLHREPRQPGDEPVIVEVWF